MRRFRAIVETHIEPEDHQVLWYYKGKLLYWGNEAWEPFLLVDALEIPYKTEEDEPITTVQEALDKLLYVVPKIESFTLKEDNIYENGATVSTLNFAWNYNKRLIKKQTLNGVEIPLTIREAKINKGITSDTSYTLWCSDGTNEDSSTVSIRFTDFIYYGTAADLQQRSFPNREKINPLTTSEITVVANKDEYIWVFIPKMTGFTKIWHNNVESTDAFTRRETGIITDTNTIPLGDVYISKNHSLNEVTLKFT